MSGGFLSHETVRIAKSGRKGPPSEADAPRATPLPGRKHKPLPGQLDLAGNETPGLVDEREEDE
jgi:hypothetical protein